MADRKRRQQSRSARSKIKADQMLDEGLKAVADGREPNIRSETGHIGTIKVLDPYEPDNKTPRTKIVNLRDDPVGQMHRRGQLGNGPEADLRLRAARRWQVLYELAEVGGARGIDMTRDVVDGGRFEMPDTESTLRAQTELNELRESLGSFEDPLRPRSFILRQRLLIWVLGDKLSLSATAVTYFNSDRRRCPLLLIFVETLDLTAAQFGMAIDPKTRRGPRPLRGRFDKIASYAENPELYRAVRRARGI